MSDTDTAYTPREDGDELRRRALFEVEQMLTTNAWNLHRIREILKGHAA